jgi:predicted RNase H-like HicB family nuclease
LRWGYTKEEALDALRKAAQAYIEVMVEKEQPVPAMDSH